jgi:four helix bundle protein
MSNAQNWIVEDLAFKQQALIFIISKAFPKEEMYSLTDQVRRSSRSICAAIAEAVGKKRYPAHMVLKLTDASAENRETKTWLDITQNCGYAAETDLSVVRDLNAQIGKLLYFMINNPEKFASKPSP